MQYVPLVFLILFLLFLLTRPFTVLWHELGHAIPVMLMTKQGATIYVGSYQDQRYSFKVSLGKLDIWFRYNPFKWRGGCCVAESTDIPVRQQIIYVLCGSLFSLFIAVIFFIIIFGFDLHGVVKTIGVIALGSTILDLFGNLIPREGKQKDGTVWYSDGYIIARLWSMRNFPEDYADAVERYQNKEYEKTGDIFKSYIDRGLVSEDVYRYAVNSYIFVREYEKAHLLQQAFEANYQSDSNDCYTSGLIACLLKKGDEMAAYFRKALELDPANAYALTGLGYYFNIQQQYIEAIPLFDKAIELQPDLDIAYNNRGHARMETGDLEGGLKDVRYSIGLDNNNSFAIRNLGIYHLLKNEKTEALQYFRQAKEMDKDTELIDEYIEKAMIL